MVQHPDLQVVTYHWSEADNFMIHASIARSYKQECPAPTASSISAGALIRLPLEIIHNILGYLDIRAIGSARCLNSQFRLIIDSFPLYRDLATHASSVLRVLNSTNLASTYSVEQLYAVLTNDRCICDAFGPYLLLTTCERCCFSCLSDPKMASTTLTTATSMFGLSKNEILKKIPVVTTLPGIYAIERTKRSRTLKIISVRKALALALRKQKKTRLREELMNLDQKAEELIRKYNDPLPFMVSTPIPYLNARDHRTEAGLWCRGCELVWYRSSSRRRADACFRRVSDTAYLENEYFTHFETCEAAKELWQLFVREGKGFEHLHKGRHREWASRTVAKGVAK